MVKEFQAGGPSWVERSEKSELAAFIDPKMVQKLKSNSGPLTILSISPWSDFGSMGTNMGTPSDYKITHGFARNRHRVVHLAPLSSGLAESENCAGISILRFRNQSPRALSYLSRLHPAVGALLEWASFNYRSWRMAVRIAREIRFDVIFGHSVYVAPSVFWLSRLWNVPSVLHIYGTFLQRQLRQRRRFFSTEYWGWRIPVTRRIIANDGTQGNEVAQHLGICRHQYVFWMNGVDKEAIERVDVSTLRDDLEIDPRARLVVLACRLAHWKRVDRLLSAAPLVLEKFDRALFVIAGDGPERARLVRRAQALGIASNVRFLGPVPRQDVIRLLRIADVFVSVNEFSNVGNPLLEALACGKAIVTLDVGATRETIKDGHNGLLVQPDDPLALADAIVRLLSDETLKSTLESNARQFARDNLLNWEERADREVRLVETLCAAARQANNAATDVLSPGTG